MLKNSILFFLTTNLAFASGVLVNDPAPGFSLKSQDGKIYSLSDYKGKWVALYFYPKDDTPGCTKQACSIRDGIKKLKKENITVFGISVDDENSHKSFATKYKLNFPLLADSNKQTAMAYGALNGSTLANRYTFIITPNQTIAKILKDVDVNSHADEIIETIKKLK